MTARGPYTLEIKLVRAQGICHAGHKVGDKFTVPSNTDRFSCDGLCIHALYSMFPKLFAMRYGVEFPWIRENPDVAEHPCPDAANPHVFQIRRVREGQREQV